MARAAVIRSASVNGTKLATIILGACCALVCACRDRVRNTAEICERYRQFQGPPVDAAWCDAWLLGWHTHMYARSKKCLARAESRLEMRLCEFEDKDAITAFPFARRECALAATTMAEFEACAETAPIESEKTFQPIGPKAVAVEPTTVLGLVHREPGWHALLLEPGMYTRSHDDEARLALVPVSSEGLGKPVWQLVPEGFDPYSLKFLVGDEFFSYLTKDGELRSVRLVEQALPQLTLKLDAKRRIVTHALLPGPTGPRGVVVTQPLGPPREVKGGGHADEKRAQFVDNWLPEFRLEPLGGEARMLVEYREAAISGSDMKFARSASIYPGAHPALVWTGSDPKRPFHVVLFDDDGNETSRAEVEGFEAVWQASTSDGITTIIAHEKLTSARDMMVFRFSVDGELGERRRLNWPTEYYAVPIACRDRLALVRVGHPALRSGDHSFTDYWDLSGRENLDLPERIWWGTLLSNIEVVAGCDGAQPAAAWISPRESQTHRGTVDSRGPFDFVFMTVP
jgi:hypothetical protein